MSFVSFFIYLFLGFDLQAVRNVRQLLRYITKEDNTPFFKGVDFDHLNFRVKLRIFAQSCPFSYNHHFVAAHHIKYKYIRNAWEELASIPVFLPLLPIGPLCPKQMEVQQFITRFDEEPPYFKKKHLLLVGQSGSGKTSAVLHALYNRKVYIGGDVSSRFVFSDIDPKYDCAFLDEFELTNENRSVVLNLLNGLPCVVNIKCEQPRRVQFNGICIFVTNFQINDEAFLNRVHLINFDE